MLNIKTISTRIKITVLLLTIGFVISSFTSITVDETKGAAPRVDKVILLIGDGMGIAQVSATMTVFGNNLNMTTTKNIGFMRTQSYDNYTTDSAASGTAMASGKKTRNGMIGMDPDSNKVDLITELVRDQRRMSYGLISTAAVTHATPASFVAHNVNRIDYEGIALDYVRNQPDVFIGGGKANFTTRQDQRDLIKVLERDGYEVVYTHEDLKVASADKVAALLADEHLPRFTEGRSYMLAESVNKAIRLLNRNNRGFFLLVEAAQIDWGGHANDGNFIIEETWDLDVAVGEALKFAEIDQSTLVIVTADHETGGMTIPGGNVEDNSVLVDFSTIAHTGVIVPVFAFGAGAEEFTGFYDNTELFDKISNLLRLRLR